MHEYGFPGIRLMNILISKRCETALQERGGEDSKEKKEADECFYSGKSEMGGM